MDHKYSDARKKIEYLDKGTSNDAKDYIFLVAKKIYK